jgi:peptidoglycan/xylan/chitin deacetylase (PgdA/CDA1 family)
VKRLAALLVAVLAVALLTAGTATAGKGSDKGPTNPPGSMGLIALTFDDGPSRELTPFVLDVLKKKDVPATFFLVGQNAEAHPDLVLRIRDEGHVIGNHSWSHPNFPDITAEQARSEIVHTNDMIQALTGTRPILFRYPYGNESEAGNVVIREQGMWGGVLWHWDTNNPGDFECPGDRGVQAYIEAEATDQAVILLHDAMDVLACNKNQKRYLESSIDNLRDLGFEFGVVAPADEPSTVNQQSWVQVVPAP